MCLTKTEARDQFIKEALEGAKPQLLVALILATTSVATAAYNDLLKKITSGKCSLKEIREWINVFTYVATPDKQLETFFSLLVSIGFQFSMEDLQKFVLAFGSSQGWVIGAGDESIKMFFQRNPEEQQVLFILRKLQGKGRVYFFKNYLQMFNYSISGLIQCLPLSGVNYTALKLIEKRDDIQNIYMDKEITKIALLASLRSDVKEVKRGAFNLLLKLKMLSKEEVVVLSEQDGTKQLAKRALKNNLQPHEED